ncbi:MAG: hypothetical protein JSV96_05595 [Candidatus Aminicenantes bacterium]|nr:MAG: hypothetical protein JSV96_05595 [Candidatus Aminicenantes bacterium]
MRNLITLIAVVLVMIPYIYSQEEQTSLDELVQVAKNALEIFNELVTAENYKSMGFESLDEVKKIDVVEPLQVFIVRFVDLLEYESGADPDEIISGGDQFIYPVTFENEVRSSIVVEKVNNEWEAARFGGASLVKLLTEFAEESDFVIYMPSLSLYFVAFYDADDKLALVPILDDSNFEFSAGEAIFATEAFDKILPIARNYKEQMEHIKDDINENLNI